MKFFIMQCNSFSTFQLGFFYIVSQLQCQIIKKIMQVLPELLQGMTRFTVYLPGAHSITPRLGSEEGGGASFKSSSQQTMKVHVVRPSINLLKLWPASIPCRHPSRLSSSATPSLYACFTAVSSFLQVHSTFGIASVLLWV